jgi:eukaryotic-like serine/threonine-protein kinase
MFDQSANLLATLGFSDIVQIGEGGTARVFKCVSSNGEVSAVKIFEPPYEADWMSRIRREATILSRLQHERVVKVFSPGLFNVGELVGLGMEYISGESLLSYCKLHEVNEEEAFLLLVKLCDGLLYVHAKNVVHRDLHAPNVMLRNGSLRDPVIVDFASARDFSLTDLRKGGEYQTFRPIGAMSHCAPEKWNRPHHVGPASDIFSVGVMMYKLLTRKSPFFADSYVDLYHKIRRGEYVPLNSYRLDLSADSVRLIEDIINPDLLWRISDAARVRERAEQILAKL